MDPVQRCCNDFWNLLDGSYGWLAEAITLCILVLFINVFFRAFLKFLHHRFEKEHRYLHDSFVKALYKPLSYYVWFIAISHSFDLIDIRLTGHNFFVIEYMHEMVIVGAVLALAWFFLRWKKFTVAYLSHHGKKNEKSMDHGKIDILSKLWTVLTLFISTLLILEATNRSLTTIIAFGGVGGLAVAFASQEIIANIFGSIMIYMTRPFSIGDWIHIPEKNIEGYVEEIGWYMTRIRTFEKRPVYVPNSTFSRIVVVTPSRMSHRQFKETFGVRYQDMPRLKPILGDIKAMVDEQKDVDQNQRKMVHFTAFGTYSVDILVDIYIKEVDTVEYAKVKEDLLFKIADIVSKNEAEMAFPTTSIELKTAAFNPLTDAR